MFSRKLKNKVVKHRKYCVYLNANHHLNFKPQLMIYYFNISRKSQSTSIDFNRLQSTSIDFNRLQSTSIDYFLLSQLFSQKKNHYFIFKNFINVRFLLKNIGRTRCAQCNRFRCLNHMH